MVQSLLTYLLIDIIIDKCSNKFQMMCTWKEETMTFFSTDWLEWFFDWFRKK